MTLDAVTKPATIAEPVCPGERYNIHTIPLYIVDRLLEAYQDLHAFVETGTYRGLTVANVLDQFDRIVTIELDEHMATSAKIRFAGRPNVTVLQGDSGALLPAVMEEFEKDRALVWLDAHWSGGMTARTSDTEHTAIFRELAALQCAPRRDHILMIDDLADFVGANGYPTIDELIDIVMAINPDYVVVRMNLRRGVLIALPPR